MIYALCAIGFLIQICFISVEHKEKYKAAVILKGTASLVFVIIGLLNCIKSGFNSFQTAVLIGLIFGMFGDILLNLRFVFEKNGQKIFLVGILIFLIGHIMYLAALVPQVNNDLICIVIGIVLTAITMYFIFKVIEAKKAFKIFGIFYIGAIMLMNVFAFANLFEQTSSATIVYAIGAILFLISDIVLILNTFGKTSKFSLRITNLTLYYLGQLAIAMSIMLI